MNRFIILFACAAACASSFVLSSCSGGTNGPGDVPPPSGSGDNIIAEFALRLTIGNVETKKSGKIDHSKGTITIDILDVRWIDNLDSAVAEFTSTGATVRVGNTTQVSGATANDFTTDVVYTVASESGEERTYTVDVIAPQASGIPVVRIDTEGRAPILDKENYVASRLTIFDGSDAANNLVEAPAGVRGRGNSTWEYPKKPYRIKLDAKASVFGLTPAKNWVLLADWQDPTYLMNHVAFELSRRLGMAFAPTATHVEFFLNGSYQGAYTMCEHIQVNEGRVDIDEFEDVFLELDTYMDEANQFYSSGLHLPVMIKSPEFEGVPAAGREAFIANLQSEFDAMENAVMSLSGWRDYIDVQSFIDFMIVNELARNAELGHPKSTYVSKKKGGKWTWGPVWDFDWAYGFSGNSYFQDYWQPGLETSLLFTGSNNYNTGAVFFNRLFNDAGFRAEYRARWNEVRGRLADIDDFVAEMGALLAESDANNKKVWSLHYTKNYRQQISAMQTWLNRRLATINSAATSY